MNMWKRNGANDSEKMFSSPSEMALRGRFGMTKRERVEKCDARTRTARCECARRDCGEGRVRTREKKKKKRDDARALAKREKKCTRAVRGRRVSVQWPRRFLCSLIWFARDAEEEEEEE